MCVQAFRGEGGGGYNTAEESLQHCKDIPSRVYIFLATEHTHTHTQLYRARFGLELDPPEVESHDAAVNRAEEHVHASPPPPTHPSSLTNE